MFGRPPFFGYTWVFYADILAGTIIGLAAFLVRRRNSDAPASGWWAVAAAIVGGVGGACVFVSFLFLAGIWSVLSFFASGPSAVALFGWTLGAMVLAALFVETSRRPGWNTRRRPWSTSRWPE